MEDRTQWIIQPRLPAGPEEDLISIEFPVPFKMKFRFLSVITFGQEADLEDKAGQFEKELERLFEKFGDPWTDYPTVKIQAKITRPFSFEKKLRLKEGRTAREFYGELSDLLNKYMPHKGPMAPPAPVPKTTKVLYRRTPSQPPIDGIIIIQEDGGNSG